MGEVACGTPLSVFIRLPQPNIPRSQSPSRIPLRILPATLLRAEVGPPNCVVDANRGNHSGLIRINHPDVYQAGVLGRPKKDPALGRCRRLDLGTRPGPGLLAQRSAGIPEAALACGRQLRGGDGERCPVISVLDNQTVFEHDRSWLRLGRRRFGTTANAPERGCGCAEVQPTKRTHEQLLTEPSREVLLNLTGSA